MEKNTQNVLGYSFKGSYSIQNLSGKIPGIYIITNSEHKISTDNIVDVGETENLEERIENHERKDCWKNNNGYFLWFHYDDNQDSRLLKEKSLRDFLCPKCGDR